MNPSRRFGASSRRIRAALAVLGLAGCAAQPIAWVKPGGDAAQFARDDAQCDYEASAATANYGSDQPTARSTGGAIGQGFAAGLGRSIEIRKLSAMCLRAKGYSQGQQVDYGTTASPGPAAPAIVPVVAKPFLSPEAATAKLDDLRAFVTTSEDAKRMFGTPMSQSAMPNNGTLLQWMYQDGAKLAHISILFGQTGTMIRVNSQTRIGF